MRRIFVTLIFALIFCPLSKSVLYADETIYSNSTYTGYVFTPSSEVFDYGITTEGLVKKIRIGYLNNYSSSNWIRISFYKYFSKTYYEMWGFMKTIQMNNLPLTSGGFSVYEYLLPEQDRFVLPPGSFGFTVEASYGINLALAYGGAGNENEMWQYNSSYGWWEPFWFGGTPWAGLYVVILKGPPIDEITCDIKGYKFDDLNGDGNWDPEEPALSGWEIYLDENGDGVYQSSEPNVVTDPNGMYFFENLESPAIYTVREIMKSGWTQTLPGGPTYQYVIDTEPNKVYFGYHFGNTQQTFNAIISGHKFRDTDGDTIQDPGEPGLSGWRIYADLNESGYYDAGEPSAVTNGSGDYQISGLAPGTYTIAEDMMEGWVQTYPTDACTYTVTISTPTQVVEDIDFGNYTFDGYGGGAGTQASPYLIYNHLHLQAVGAHWWDWDAHFRLMDNIDLSKYTGEQFNLIGRYNYADQLTPFSGVFDGNGYTISNFRYRYTQSPQEYIGLFGYVWLGEIKNLRMENVEIDTRGNGVDSGALVGRLYDGSLVSNCHANGGSVTVQNSGAGGLVGWIRSGTVTGCSANLEVASAKYNAGGITSGNYEGTISDCFFEGTVYGQQDVGGVVGINQSVISRCSANAVVDGFQHVGGLAGANASAGIISECYSQGTVVTHTDPQYGLAGNEAGGFVGRNSDGDVLNSYSMASVSSVQKVGGFAGIAWGASQDSSQILNCYAVGAVSGTSTVGGFIGWNVDDFTAITGCFWDALTTGRPTSDGGTGLPTGDLQIKQTYLDAGWDFIDETPNGTEDLWQLCEEGSEYPELAWTTTPCGVTTVVFTAIEDTYIRKETPDTNYGDVAEIFCGLASAGARRAAVKFDLSSIPPGQVIVSAVLQMNCSYITIPAPEVGVYYASNSWDEMTTTWNDPPYLYTSPPLNQPVPLDQTVVALGLNTWEVTDKADTRYTQDGIFSLALQTDEQTMVRCGFYSREALDPDWAPKLIVRYKPIFGGGTGIPENPFQIWTAEQMNTIGLYSNRWDRHYRLMADISMAAYTGVNYNPIGIWSTTVSQRVAFTGVFNGNRHTISDFQSAELFDYINGGRVQMLGLIAPAVTGSGALVYRAEWSDIVECWVDGGSVQGGATVGGLVGYMSVSNLCGCRSSAAVTGSGDAVGGLIGSAYNLNHIENCSSTGSVSGQDGVGGFVGEFQDSVMINCYSAGPVTGTGLNVGGFCGMAENYYFYGQPFSYACYWDTEASTQPDSAAGTGMPTADMMNLSMYLAAGWDFVDETDNGQNDDWAIPPGGGYPVLWYQLAVLPPLPTFAGGDGSQGDPYQVATVQQFNSIGHHTRLLDKHFELLNDLNFAGQTFVPIADGPYALMGSFDGNGHTIKNAALSISYYHSHMGFVGTIYTGRVANVTLRNFAIEAERTRNVGSVAGMNRSGRIENCTVYNADVTGLWDVGGLVGLNYRNAEISGCSVSGDVRESRLIPIIGFGTGGLVGENSWWSTVETSCAFVDVNGVEYVGGLIGTSALYGEFTDCYAAGKVTASEDYAGSLVGRAIGNTFTRCYAACEIMAPSEAGRVGVMAGYDGSGRYVDCFWDNEINGAMPGFGGTSSSSDTSGAAGLPTAEMQTALPYESAGWDFIYLWTICQGTNYPRFQRQVAPADFLCPDGVDLFDLMVMTDEWLAERRNADIAPDGGDGFVDLIDWQHLAAAWQTTPASPNWDAMCDIAPPGGDSAVDLLDIAAMADAWLFPSAQFCDIAPAPDGDGRVDLQDFAAFTEYWMQDNGL